MSLAVALTIGADARQMGVDGLAGEQHAEVVGDDAVWGLEVEDSVEDQIASGGVVGRIKIPAHHGLSVTSYQFEKLTLDFSMQA